MRIVKTLKLPTSKDIPFVDRPPTPDEVEALRLLMSTFLDGTGGFKDDKAKALGFDTLPAWRDFERTLALVVRGFTTEDKASYDIMIPTRTGKYAGISCKMRGKESFNRAQNKGRLLIEVTNAATQLKEVAGNDWESDPASTGTRLLEKIHDDYFGGKASAKFDVGRTSTVHWAWKLDHKNKQYVFEIFLLKRPICTPSEVTSWRVRHGKTAVLVGLDKSNNILIEWYPNNGQLKYFPLIEHEVRWRSGILALERVDSATFSDTMLKKVATYFGTQIVL